MIMCDILKCKDYKDEKELIEDRLFIALKGSEVKLWQQE